MSAASPFETCDVRAVGSISLPVGELPAYRKQLAGHPRGSLAPLLRNADEQTVLAIGAVLRAIETAGWADDSFEDWGVIAAPRHLGRGRVASSWEKFQRNGVRGVSPWAIPNLSLHSMSGTVSLVLRSHGPNLGVGGSRGQLGQALHAVLGLIDDTTPSWWWIVTEWSPDAVVDAAGEVTNPCTGHALALAVGRNAADALWRMHVHPLKLRQCGDDDEPPLHLLIDSFADAPGGPSGLQFPGGTLELVPLDRPRSIARSTRHAG